MGVLDLAERQPGLGLGLGLGLRLGLRERQRRELWLAWPCKGACKGRKTMPQQLS